MNALERIDRDLLEFLCICAAKRITIKKIHPSRAGSLERLRRAQQIRADSFEPFPWALEAWRSNHANRTEAPIGTEQAEPPMPTAVGCESAALCSEDAGDQHAAGIAEAALSDHCQDCGAPLSRLTGRRRRGGKSSFRCKPCYEAWNRAEIAKHPKPPRLCSGCQAPISATSKGMCRKCRNAIMNRDPSLRARKSDTMKQITADPAYREHLSRKCKEATASPEARERLRRTGAMSKGRKNGPLKPDHREAIAAGVKAHFARKREIDQQSNTSEASGTARKAPGAAGSPVAKRIEDRASIAEPAPKKLPPSASAHVPKPVTPLMDLAERQRATAFQNIAARRRGVERQAAARLDAGEKPRNSVENALMMQIQRRRVEEARLLDPVEAAKTALRKRFAPVCNAEIVDGPKGMFVVGRKIVSKAELLDMAEAMAA